LGCQRGSCMSDLLFLGGGCALMLLMIAYAALCRRL
jgi:hypothetical protein